MIEARNLSFSYPDKSVLVDVSLVASPGEVVAVVGSNGAGKTTLLRILSTVTVPDGGMVLCEGVDAFSRPLKYRRQIGYLSERVALYDDMTVREYLAYRASLKGEPARRVRRRIGEAVEICRVADLMRTPIARLSLGLRKRVALADALLLRPRVLLLDDFLAGLDCEMREAAGEILSDAAAFSSVVVTGHELEELSRWAMRFLVLRNGRIAASVPTSGADRTELCARLMREMAGGGR